MLTDDAFTEGAFTEGALMEDPLTDDALSARRVATGLEALDLPFFVEVIVCFGATVDAVPGRLCVVVGRVSN